MKDPFSLHSGDMCVSYQTPYYLLTATVGCQSRISPEGDQTPRICPRCHNGQRDFIFFRLRETPHRQII